MSDRLNSQFLVQALVRRVNAQGGFATVVHKGDSISGSILLLCIHARQDIRLFERIYDFSGGYKIISVAENSRGDEGEINAYITRRRQSDPDLWVVELDVPNGEQLIAGLFGSI